MPGRANSAGGSNVSSGGTHAVTTPSGPHMMKDRGQMAAKQSMFSSPVGIPERTNRRGVAATLALQTGRSMVNSVTTAQFRQQRPLPVRSFGMNSQSFIRRMPAVR